jgi:hypothetical protein
MGLTPSGSLKSSFLCDRILWVSVVVWYIPVINADLLGAHTGEVEKTFVNRTPFPASASRFGVETFDAP